MEKDTELFALSSFSYSQKQRSVDDDTRKWDWQIQDITYNLNKSTVCVVVYPCCYLEE